MIHAKLYPPSGANGWMFCAGWTGGSGDNQYSMDGTAAHFLGSSCLKSGFRNAVSFLGQTIYLYDGYETWTMEGKYKAAIKVDTEMCRNVQGYIDYVRKVQQETQGELHIEVEVPLIDVTGEEANGHVDALIVTPRKTVTTDYKNGHAPVAIEDNLQLQIYALGASDEHSLSYEFEEHTLVIYQPQDGGAKEWTITTQQLEDFRLRVATAVKYNQDHPDSRTPGEAQYKYCSRKATCEALSDVVKGAMGIHDFDDIGEAVVTAETDDTALSKAMSAAKLIEDWLSAVRAEVEKRLLVGTPVAGWKLVQGKKGNRAWTDAEAAEKYLKDTVRVKIEDMYDLKLISPTKAEKLTTPAAEGEKPILGPRQWTRVKELIGQSEGQPSVAPASDKRPAILVAPRAEDFDDLS